MNWSAAVVYAVGAVLASNAFAQNGGTSCATATPLVSGIAYTADTTAAPNWMASFGPLVSPSNDVVYSFVGGTGAVTGELIPTQSDYAFAMYLIASCTTGAEPAPIGATGTVGVGIDLASAGVIPGITYYVAVTGTAAGGAGANGTLSFTGNLEPVALQSFEVD